MIVLRAQPQHRVARRPSPTTLACVKAFRITNELAAAAASDDRNGPSQVVGTRSAKPEPSSMKTMPRSVCDMTGRL